LVQTRDNLTMDIQSGWLKKELGSRRKEAPWGPGGKGLPGVLELKEWYSKGRGVFSFSHIEDTGGARRNSATKLILDTL